MSNMHDWSGREAQRGNLQVEAIDIGRRRGRSAGRGREKKRDRGQTQNHDLF